MITMRIMRIMRKTGVFHALVLVFMLTYLVSAPPWARADIPRYINYQGKLTDADDNPITDDVSITVRIYDAASGGTALWEEVQTVTATMGIFSMLLGSTTALDDLDFDDAYWYSVEVESDGEMTPRQRLTAVAYAINADKLDGYDASDFLQTAPSGDLTLTGGANEDIEINPTGTGEVIITIDSTSGDFKITDGTTNYVLVDSETGNVTIANDLTVSGTIYGTLAASGSNQFTSIVVTGTSDLRGNISNTSATGAVTIADALTQTGSSNQVTFAGNVDANAGLDVTGALTVSGATTLSSALDMNANIDLDYSGTSAALNVAQAGAGTAATFTGGEVVIGADTGIDIATTTGNLYVQNDLEVDGTIYGNISSSGSTIDNSVIGGTTPAAGTFTTLTATTLLDVDEEIDIDLDASDEEIAIDSTYNVSTGTAYDLIRITETLTDSGGSSGTQSGTVLAVNLNNTLNGGLTDNTNIAEFEVDGSDVAVFNAGGDLEITGDATISGGAINLGAAANQAGTVVLYDGDETSGETLTLDMPNIADAGSWILTLPAADGTIGQLLKTDGSGNLGWATDDAGGSMSSFTLSDGSTTETIEQGNTLTVSGGTAITSTVSSTDTVTLGVTDGSINGTQLADTISLDAATTITSSPNALTIGGGTNKFTFGDGAITETGTTSITTDTLTVNTLLDVDEDIDIDLDATDEELDLKHTLTTTGTLDKDSVVITRDFNDTADTDDLSGNIMSIVNTVDVVSGGSDATNVLELVQAGDSTGSALALKGTGSFTAMTFDDAASTDTLTYDSTAARELYFTGSMSAVDFHVRGASPAILSFGSDAAGTSLIYDPATDQIRFSRGTFAQDFRNKVKNASFEAFSAMEKFHDYDSAYTTATSTETEFGGFWNKSDGFQGGWDKFAPDDWDYISGNVYQHAPLFFETGFTDTAASNYEQDFAEGVSAVRLAYSEGSVGKISQTISELKPSTVYSVGVSMRVDSGGEAKIDIEGEDGTVAQPTDVNVNAYTQLPAGGINSSVKSIPVNSITNFAPFGTIKIGDERIRYEGLDDGATKKFLKCTRGSNASSHSAGDYVIAAPFIALETSTDIIYKRFEGQFTTDPKASDITIVLSAEKTSGEAAYFDTVQVVAGGTVPEYAPGMIVDTGDQSIYGSLRIGRASDDKGGILSVDKFVRTRGIELFTDDPGMTGETGGGDFTMDGGGVFPPGPGWNETDGAEASIQLYVSGDYNYAGLDPQAPPCRDFKVVIDDDDGDGAGTTGSTYTWYYMDNQTGWTYQTGGTGINVSGVLPTSPAFLSNNQVTAAGVEVDFSASTGTRGDTWWFHASSETFYQDDMSYQETTTYTPGKTRIYVDPELSSPYYNQLVFEDGGTKVSLSQLAGTVDTQSSISSPSAWSNSGWLDMSVSGNYTGTVNDANYEVQIVNNGTGTATSPSNDTFKYNINYGSGYVGWSSEFEITGSPQDVGNGVFISFSDYNYNGYYLGGVVGDTWSFTAYASASGGGESSAITDGDFTSNGLMKRTGAGAYTVDTVNLSAALPQSRYIMLPPEFPTGVLSADGTSNTGTLTASFDGSNFKNYYNWTTTEGTTQDYDIVVRVIVPEDFNSWDSTAAISFYNLVDASPGASGVTITVYDTTDWQAYTSGSTVKNTTWTATNVTAANLSAGTFTAGSYMTIKFKLLADNGKNAKLGDVTLKYNRNGI